MRQHTVLAAAPHRTAPHARMVVMVVLLLLPLVLQVYQYLAAQAGSLTAPDQAHAFLQSTEVRWEGTQRSAAAPLRPLALLWAGLSHRPCMYMPRCPLRLDAAAVDADTLILALLPAPQRHAEWRVKHAADADHFSSLPTHSPAACRPGQALGLTRGEALQVLNSLPRTPVEVHLMLPRCEERLGEPGVDALLAAVQEFLPAPLPAAEQEQEQAEEEQ